MKPTIGKRILQVGMLALVLATLASAAVTAEEYPTAIEDNSFFIEEAYNQEFRVVQHIFNVVTFPRPSRDWLLGFTQEWPFFSPKHQLSATLPYMFLDGGATAGFGDILINYRFQLFSRHAWAALAPRLSLIVPTGSDSRGLGNGVWGWQLNLPASKRLARSWVVHANVGFTLLPGVKVHDEEGSEHRRTLTSYNFGGSVILLLRPGFNLLLEVLDNVNAEITSRGGVQRTNELIVSPGLRGAVNIGRLQVVPGVAVPLKISGDQCQAGVFLYLSLEHPY